MTNGYARRGFLGIAGTGAAASLAGCTALGNLTQEDSDTDDLLTVMVRPDEDDMDALIEEVEAGETDPAEARQRQGELLAEAADAFRQRADEEDGLTIEDETEELGLFRVDSGDDALLVELLRDGEIGSIHDGDAYDQILERQQQRQQQQQAPPQEPPEQPPEEGANDSDGDDETGETDGDEDEAGNGNGNESE